VRYPKAYLALQDAAATKTENRASLQTAMWSPIESSAIPVQVSVEKVDKPSPHSLSIFGTVDIHNLRLMQEGGQRKGALNIVTIEQDESGKILAESPITLNLQLTDQQYTDYLKSGFRFHKFVEPRAETTTLRFVVEDAGTALVGSVIIPLAQLK